MVSSGPVMPSPLSSTTAVFTTSMSAVCVSVVIVGSSLIFVVNGSSLTLEKLLPSSVSTVTVATFETPPASIAS